MLQSTQTKIYYTLRIACAMCFIGHGAFGIITKAIWCNYFAVFGIGHEMAFTLMPYVGVMDICFGLIILFYPLRIVVGWLVAWGFFTACLRPLSGEPFAELIERAGNFGVPLALLLLTYSPKNNNWVKPVRNNQIQFNAATINHLKICLQMVVFLLFIGHGWLNLTEKKSLLDEYHAIGFANASGVAHIVGSLEIFAAIITLIKPVHSLLIIFFIWKVISELLYPHWEIFEWIERGGSYGAILALWFLTKPSASYSFIKEGKTNAAA